MRLSILASPALAAVLCWPALAGAQPPTVHTDTDLEKLLAEKAGLTVDLPERGYTWADSNLTGTPEDGSFLVETDKVIYYFVHWGPQETDTIDEAYARKRIPEVWPSEGLKIVETAPATVAGHPAIYAVVEPKWDFYRSRFLIWNCPESGRQFIADMNYNVRYHTPESAIETEVATTEQTLACHPGAPVSELPGNPVHFASERFGVSFDHPLDWYVFESPYGVAHPAYRGVRDRTIGSLLAWFQDVTTEIAFRWQPLPAPDDSSQGAAGAMGLFEGAVAAVNELDQVAKFDYQAYEAVRYGGNKTFKLLGTVDRKAPAEETPGFQPRARAMAVVVDDEASGRRFSAVLLVDFYTVEGEARPPVRDIFDRWAAAIAEGLAF